MKINQKNVFETEINGKPFRVEIGEMAKQANGACMVYYGDTAVLAAVTASKKPKDLPFFPLQVNYEERLYSVGKIPGGFIKREGRPSENAVLTSRLIDRPIRPLFPEDFRNEVQVITTVMSVEQDCSPEIAAMIGASISLSISDIPFDGPIAGINVGQIDGEFVVNPSLEQQEKSELELTVAGTKDGVNMVEAGAEEVTEDIILDAIMFGHKEIVRLVEFQEEIVNALDVEKFVPEVFELDEAIAKEVEAKAKDDILAAIKVTEKKAREEAIESVKDNIISSYDEDDTETMVHVKVTLDNLVKDGVRYLITDEKIRPDGRRIDEIRDLASRTDILPRTHGSGLFTRGQTQALSVCTLGSLSENQFLDGIDLEETKRFMHHYNFPQYSVGETGPIRGPGRREIGHGALGERALEKVLPSEEEFPYTIRVVSEVLESNGSSSQASICAGTLSMMDAGVPIKAPVAGIAMGLIKTGENYSVLSDIQGLEDALGDMDFKVAGTEKGITALQMDIKIDGLNRNILKESLEQAKIGRLAILKSMVDVINTPKEELSKYAPKIISMQIDPDKIRTVIGPSGKQINKIIDETGVKIDIEQDGNVYISSTESDKIDDAKQIIEDLVREAKVGEIYLGEVKRIEKFGAFVEIFKGKDGLVHISELQDKRTEKVEDVLKIGDEVMVKVIEIDRQGRVNLSRKQALKEEAEKESSNK
ncbi:MAG TPA: polyribonucleotide nucleotidyltransferase [Pseudogracilibacillus sp.]|nr:polyribonucleotide nucleotidyltransferase [Pseudogracilibacillus sp.]